MVGTAMKSLMRLFKRLYLSIENDWFYEENIYMLIKRCSNNIFPNLFDCVDFNTWMKSKENQEELVEKKF